MQNGARSKTKFLSPPLLCVARKRRTCSPRCQVSLTPKTCCCSPCPSAPPTPPSPTTSTSRPPSPSLWRWAKPQQPSTDSLHFLSPFADTKWNWRLVPKRRGKVTTAEIWLWQGKKKKTLLHVYPLKNFSLCLISSAARTAVLSFMKAKETSARERDLYRSVKVSQ